MDGKKLNELKGELLDQFDYAEQVLQAYQRGEITFEKVSQELNKLNEINGQISICVMDGIRDFHTRARAVKQERAKKVLGELGYQP